METSFANWIAWLEALAQEAMDEGSLSATMDTNAFAQRVTAIIDGLGSQVVRGLLTRPRASELLAAWLDREFADGADGADAHERSVPREPAPASGYLRLLARLTHEAVAELESLAGSDDEREAVRVVCDLVDRVSGNAASSTTAAARGRSHRNGGSRPSRGY